MAATTRNSSFELIRLWAQFFIVFYHMMLVASGFLQTGTDYENIKILWIPLHIGVPVFVMISGYFGIRPSIKGLFKLLITCFIYVSITNVIMWMITGGGKFPFSKLLIVSSSHWFVRTYIYLYLFSPVLNAYIKRADGIKLFYLLSVLLFINVYVGFIGKDISLTEGKTLSNFCLFYVIGACLCRWNYMLKRISSKWYFCAFALLNLIICSGYYGLQPSLAAFVWKLSFPYHSPFILISSALFICMIANMQIQSAGVNRIAKSTFAIYLLHCSGLAMDLINKPIIRQMIENTNQGILLLLYLFLYAIIVFIVCIVIDQVLMPMWDGINHILEKKCKAYDLSV